MILTITLFVLLGLLNPFRVSAIPSPDLIGPIISWVVFMLGFVSLGFGILASWFARLARALTPEYRRRAFVGLAALFLMAVLWIGALGWLQYRVKRPQTQPGDVVPPVVTPITPPATTTSTVTNGLISSRVASSTIIVPIALLKEVVATPNWSDNILLLDIREPEEREVGAINATSTWMREGDVRNGGIALLPRDKDILVICWTSLRGQEIATLLRQHGIPTAYAIQGGLQGALEPEGHGWIPDGLPWKGDTKWSTAFAPFDYPKIVSLSVAKQWYDNHAIILDVREPESFQQAHLTGAISLPLQLAPSSLVSATLSRLPPVTSTPILVYSDGYINSFYAKVLGLRLLRLGYTNTRLFLDEGHTWMNRRYPTSNLDKSSLE